MNEPKKMNLYQKLIEVRKEVLYLKKEASGFKYKYATEGDILEKIRPAMDKLGVFLEVDVPEMTAVKGDLLRTTMRFIWVNADDPEQRIEKTVKLCESGDIDIKKCGSLMTYGTKYFLFKFFNIETGEDDPDVKQDPKMSKEHIDELVKLYKDKGTKELYEKHLKGFNVSHLKEIDDSQFPVIFYWISKFHELQQKEEKKS